MKILHWFVAAFLLWLAQLSPALAADTVASASSPGGVLTLHVTVNGEGRVGYSVTRLGKPVISES